MSFSTQVQQKFLAIVLLLIGVTALPTETAAQLMAGKEFVVALPSFWRRPDGGNPGNFQITIMCSRRTNVTVKWSGPGGGIVDQGTIEGGNRLTIQPPRFQVVNLMQQFEDRDTIEVNQRSFYIQADQPVSVFAIYDDYRGLNGSYTEMYSIPPIESYDTAYMSLNYMAYIGRNTGFLILAKEDGTQVTIDPKITWSVPGILPGSPATINLNKYQVFQVMSFERGSGPGADLSGTPIKSNKPIGIIPFTVSTASHASVRTTIVTLPSGVRDTVETPDSVQYNWRLSPAADVLPPEAKGGTLFYTASMGPQDSSQVKVVALKDTTIVSLNGIQKALLNRGEYREMSIGGAAKITSSKPIIAMQVSRSGNNPIRDTILQLDPSKPNQRDTIKKIFGNPAMAWLPPVTEYKPTLQWTNPLLAHHKTPIPGKDSALIYPWHHYAMVTAPTSALASVKIDGQPVKFQFTHIDGQYATAIVPILPKQHVLTADAPVMCIPYGFAWDDAYAFIAGEALRSIAVINVDSVVASSCDTLLDVFFDIENRGNNNFRIDSINADGIQIQNIREPIGFPTEMPPGRLLPAHVLFKLPQPGTYTGTLRVYTDANNQALLEIPFRITRDSAQLAFPDIIDFGQIDAAKTSADTTVTITNNGNNDLTINSLSFDDPRFEVIQPAPPLTIPPGGSRTVRVRITPRPGVPERGTLTIIAEPCFTPVDIEVRGFQGAGPLIGIPRSIQFPPFLCDAPEFVDTTIVITAIGDEPLQIDNIQLGGDNPERFSFRRNPAPTTILPQQTDSIVIRYTPSIIGVHRAVVDIRSNARNATDPLQITLTGRKDTAIALPKQRTINFGQLLDCDEPVEMQLTLSNSGTVDATISEIQLDTDAPFSISQSLPFSIPANGTERIITIRFAPQSDGVFTEELRIIGEPCGIDEVITLNGSRQTPSLAADIAMIDFDTVYLCDGATSRTFTLTNDGPVADTIRRFTPAGSDAFSLGGEVYPIILQPGESKNFTLQFDPVIGADVNGSLEFFWGPCDKTTIVNFRGVGADPKVTLSEQSIDFAQVDVVAGLPARRSITIRNEGNAPRVISGINFGGESSLRVVVPTSFPVTIAAGEELVVEIEYLPTQVGLLNATAVVAVEDPCGSSESFGLTGEGTGVKVIEAKLTIRVPQNLSGVVDNLVSIPVEITGGENIAEAGIRELDVKLSWRYTMLLPQSVRTDLPGLSTRILSNEIVGDRRVVELGFFGLDDGSSFPANGTLGTIGALVLLGDRAETDIRVEEIRTVVPANRVMSYQSEDGKFVLLGLCTLDGDRLVSLGGGSLKLSSPRPNPVSGISEFEVETSESGYVEVVLYDAMGTQVKELYAGEVASGVYLLRIDASELSSGLYFCELRRGNAVVRQHVIVTQ